MTASVKEHHSQIYPKKEDEEMLAPRKIHHLRLKLVFPCPRPII